FHQALARAGHNAVLYKMSHLLTRPRVAQGLRVEHALPDIMAGEYDSHLALHRAVCTRDPAVARLPGREHPEIAPRGEDQIAALQRQIANNGRRHDVAESGGATHPVSSVGFPALE